MHGALHILPRYYQTESKTLNPLALDRSFSFSSTGDGSPSTEATGGDQRVTLDKALKSQLVVHVLQLDLKDKTWATLKKSNIGGYNVFQCVEQWETPFLAHTDFEANG